MHARSVRAACWKQDARQKTSLLVAYHNLDFILSLLQLEWAKSYRVTLCQHNYQMPSVTSFVFLKKILATLYETSVQFRIKVIGAETQADLEMQYVDQFK